MSYTPTTWANGDTITATKLNNAEQGIVNAGSGFDVVITYTNTVPTSSTYTLVSGDLDTCYYKITHGIPILAAFVLWADPSSAAHDKINISANVTANPNDTQIGFEYASFLTSAYMLVWDANGLTLTAR